MVNKKPSGWPEGAVIYANGTHLKKGVKGNLFRWTGLFWKLWISEVSEDFFAQGAKSYKKLSALIDDVVDFNNGFHSGKGIYFDYSENVFGIEGHFGRSRYKTLSDAASAAATL